jgi:hypothetical protein
MEDKKISDKRFNFIATISLLLALILYATLVIIINMNRDDANRTRAKLAAEEKQNYACTYKTDSLLKEVNNLSKYKSLTLAMIHRDEAEILLKYKVGDVIYLKRDSSRVVVEDILIGGAKYEYYIRYKVLHIDKSIEEVKPELIY